MNENTDESDNPRLGLTSASSAEADNLCPGRHLAQRGMKSYETKDAEGGQLVHAAFSGALDPKTLSGHQRKTLERGREIEEHVVEQWFQQIGHPLDPDHIEKQIAKRAHRELRLWAYRNMQKIHSGAVDALWLAGDMKFGLVEDLKSLFGDIDDAASNLQIRDYAALVHLNYGCENVTVFINQPNVRWKLEDQKMVNYTGASLQRAVKDMERRVLNSQRLDAKRKPGIKQCAFCAACATTRCPESMRAVWEFSGGEPAGWEYWSPAERGQYIETTKTAEKIIERVLAVAKENLKKDEKWAEGWQMTPDISIRTIKDVPAAGEALATAFGRLAVEKLAAICKVSITDLEALHGELTEMVSTEDRKAEFNVLFTDLIERSTRAGSLKRLK